MAQETTGIAPAGKNAARTPQRTPQREPQRQRNKGARQDFFYVDPRKIPPGMDYNWKLLTLIGQEQVEHQTDMKENGAWTEVPAKRHPELAGRNAHPESAIIRRGMVLMERPKELSAEARAEDRAAAAAQMGDQQKRLGMAPEGTMTRRHQKINNKIDRSFDTGIEVDPNDADDGGEQE